MRILMSFFLFFSFIFASTARIMTYNLLNFEDDNSREDDYIAILEFAEPDLIIAQEVVGQTGFSKFKSDVLDMIDPDAWSSAPFTSQSAQQDIALFYHHDHFTFVSTSIINTAQSSGTRDVIEWVMVHTQSGIEFNVYGVHFKASSGDSNAAERLEEATILRNYLNELPENTQLIVGGDFNIYSNNSSSEPAFDMLTGSGDDNNGQLFDPVDRIGHWHNNSSYADVHTQSPRTSNFGGGATGGMDDRFDWLFVSDGILDDLSDMRYVEDTYWAVGNDGNHFNDAINDGNNTSVSDEIADALHDASDHLPVYMDVWFDDLVYTDQGVVITEIMVNPAAVSDSYGEWFEITNTTDTTIDIHGWTIKDGDSDEHEISNDSMAVTIAPSDYFVLASNGDSALNGGLNANYDYDDIFLSNSEGEIILLDGSGAIVDEVHYDNSWAFGSGESMEIHDVSVDNNNPDNWFEAILPYGDGDLGTPGTDWQGTVQITAHTEFPSKIELLPCYPNPFNPSTIIQFELDRVMDIELQVYDITGKIIKSFFNARMPMGLHQIEWIAENKTSGIYFIHLTSEKHSHVQKVILVK